MSARVAVVVPIFNPDPPALTSLVRGLVARGLPLLIVDDASTEASDLESLEALGAETRRHPENAGIARSLNDGLAFAADLGADWLLTVDQDTVLPGDYLDSLLASAAPGIGVIGAEVIADVSGDLHYPTHVVGDALLTEEVFQTGSLWSVPAMEIVGGFDEAFGIDAVDAAACLRLREAGFTVALAPGLRLQHHYGSGHAVQVLGRTIWATGHAPARRETMVRNRLRLFPREFRQSPAHALRTLRRLGVNVALAVTVEDDRWAKAKGAARGLMPRRSR